MRYLVKTLTFLVLLTSCHSKSVNRIRINIPSADVESEYIWRTIQDISFFEKNNYQLNLPQGHLIDELKAAAKEGTLAKEDYNALNIFVRKEVYNKEDYLKGYEKIRENITLINKMINKISQTQYPWHFKEFNSYQLNLTLYGPGGSYNSDDGSILILTTPDGQFKQYDNPANTIIHEITHIGVQQSIIDKHHVPHALKERIVDTFVFLNFHMELPNYKVQEMGYEGIDRYLKTKDELRDLEDTVRKVMISQ